MENQKFIEIIGLWVAITEFDGGCDFSGSTDLGVDMNFTLYNEEGTFLEQFAKYIKDFSVDAEIELHREDEKYKKAFSIRDSLEDFEGYQRMLATIMKHLEAEDVDQQ